MGKNENNGGLIFGEILFMLISGEDAEGPLIFFVVKKHQSVFDVDLHLYQIPVLYGEAHSSAYDCARYIELLDYNPLPAYRKNYGMLLIPLKHAIFAS